MQIPRYVVGALLFALIWATIAYTQQGMRDPKQLAIGVLLFFVLGSGLSWALSLLIKWLRNRR